MNLLLQDLFHTWCTPYLLFKTPSSMKNNPAAAYGEYTFEAGFRMGMQLAICCLDPDMLADPDVTAEDN